MYQRNTFEEFDINDFRYLGKYQYDKASEGLASHFHSNCMEIIFCYSGSQSYEVNQQLYHLKGGDVFMIFPNELHSTNHEPEEKGTIYWLQLYIDSTNKHFLGLNEGESHFIMEKLMTIPNRCFKAESKQCYSIFEKLIFLAENERNVEQTLRIKQLLYQFLFLLIDTSTNQQIISTDNRTLKINKFINDNLHKSLSIKTLADYLFLSESRFKSWFKEEFGMPAIEYCQRERIDKSIQLYRNNKNMSISDIAYTLGFQSPQHFSSLFKKFKGISPSVFIRNLN